MVERSQNSNHNLEMLPSLTGQSPNFKAFHDLTLAFLFGLIVLLLFFFFFILGSRKCSAFPNFLASCFCIFTHAALCFVQKSFPAGKHLSFKIQLKLYLFLEAFSDSFSIQQKQLLTLLCTLTVHV